MQEVTMEQIRFFTWTACLAAAVAIGCTPPPAAGDVILIKEGSFVEESGESPGASEYQLDSSARIPEAEARFISSLKKAIRSKDKKAIERLYELKGANPAFVEIVPSVIEQLSRLDGAEFMIEANDKAARHGTRFTVPYLGDVVIQYRDKTSGSTMRVPVGISGGRYYLTVGALPEK